MKSFLYGLIMLSTLSAANEITELKFNELTSLFSISDKTASAKMQDRINLLIGASDQDLSHIDKNADATTFFNVFVLKHQDKIAIFDTGFGPSNGGLLVQSLASLNIEPAQVTDVLMTHFHGDHTGGLLNNNMPVFPNATLHLSKQEFDSYDENSIAKKAVSLMKSNIVDVNDIDQSLQGIKLPNLPITIIGLFGHTAGHSIYAIEDILPNEQNFSKVIVAGDFMHLIEVQAQNPKVAIKYDSSPELAVKNREILLESINSNDTTLIAGYHLPYPGFVKFQPEEQGYSYHPLQ